MAGQYEVLSEASVEMEDVEASEDEVIGDLEGFFEIELEAIGIVVPADQLYVPFWEEGNSRIAGISALVRETLYEIIVMDFVSGSVTGGGDAYLVEIRKLL